MKATTTKELVWKDKSKPAIPVGTECEISFDRGSPICTVAAPGQAPGRLTCLKLPTYFAKDFTRPNIGQLEEWSNDGICESVTGHCVEPDGWGPDGAPSWLLALGYI